MPATERPASDIPFERLFPDLDDHGRERLVAAAQALDLRRSLDDPARWFWNEPDPLSPEPEPEPSPHILGTALLLYEADGDWLELGLDVWQLDGPFVSVTATVEVACWCDTDHNMHAVQRAEWPASTAQAFLEAFHTAALSVIRRIEGPRDPRDLRARAGLPNPPEPPPEDDPSGPPPDPSSGPAV
ncbi:hypothetical protein OG948_26205 [Embleya sp. NBC_00888]|uniref:hypothetical protein n=1 Tax=Embleya sp. NBC_00888 TaxID=2975960 RepID=UPI0038634DDD|nr:hypothetical protein OG948_26205 [Embleya sp. NBC_00888]